MKLFDLSHEVAVVIGATGVLGGMLAEGLAEAGAKIAVLGRNEERGEARVKAIAAKGGTAAFFSCDATSRNSLAEAHAKLEARLGPPAILINAAGGNDPKVTVTAENPFEKIPLEAWHANFDLNLVGGVLLPCQEFGPAMCQRGRGSIVNVASVSAHLPLSRVVSYSASKAAVLNLSLFLAREWAQKGVRVNTITPGFFPAEQNRKLLFNADGSPTDRTKSIWAHTPMNRFGESQELVGACVFLASHKASSFVTGSDIRVDGGFFEPDYLAFAPMNAFSKSAFPGKLTDAQVTETVAQALPVAEYRGKKILLIVPDNTRTAPIGLMFKTIFKQIGAIAQNLDVLVALGTHPPMTEEAICERLEISVAQHQNEFRQVRLFNHEWDNPAALREIGTLAAADIKNLTGGLFSMDVSVEINKLVFDYDRVLIVGPVFPHEVVGFSGGNKYLFPGVGGPRILNFFHWLGAIVTNPMIIGNKWTAVRRVVDRAAALLKVDKACFCLVVAPDKSLVALSFGTPDVAWDAASEVSRQVHIVYKDHPFKTVLSKMPLMYDDLWVAGKGMYKLEPVVADGGELIIYAPHVTEISTTHGRIIEEIGYHCRDYFLAQWDKFKDKPWGVLAHSTHVRGIGKMENGVEKCRIQVTLATGIPESVCKKINLGHRDPETIREEDFAGREGEGVLFVPKAGEMLYHLRKQPKWAGGQ